MIIQKNSDNHYVEVLDMVRDISPSVRRMSAALVRPGCDYIGDCRQVLFMHAIEAYNDTSSSLPFQQLLNRLWWRCVDYVKRDTDYNFWKKHISIDDVIPDHLISAKYADSGYEEELSDVKIDIGRVVNYASSVLSERDFVIFLLNLEGLSLTDITRTVYPETDDFNKSLQIVKSSIWRAKLRLKEDLQCQIKTN